ncbi:ERI1 exoribonuclease 2-like [Daphnia pulicaria]|uniref:ERI1 exoribonuclease 2-like n=1 Tax=Daphnia pulicaria TaxID=35523 RepID=UPI001EEC5A8D|nr:ERI1 exoribonuclease 2-like [Daphnia pulicaria]
MDAYSDDINKDSTSQYAICAGKVNGKHSKQKIHQTKNVSVSCIGDFKNMPKAMLLKNLKLFKLNTNGSRKVLMKRLEMYNKKTTEMFDYYVVIDYEATCDENHKNFDKNNQEIIEFPAVLLNCHTGKVEAEFQSYCRPVINPLLTKYCIKLTGITQNIVDKAPSFHEVLASFEKWLQNKKLGSEYSFAILTDGSKDVGHFLKTQCVLSQIDIPEYCKYWINIRKSFTNFYQTNDLQYFARLANDTVLNIMIKEIGCKFQGKPHSGLDDARNIAYVAQCLLQDGASLVFNEKLSDENAEKKANSNSSFSTPVSKAEFSIICGTLKPNFQAKKSPVTSKTPDTNTVAKDVLVKACNSETKAKPVVKEVVKIPAIASNSAIGASTKTTDKKKKNQHSTKDTVKIPATKKNQPNMQPDSLVKTSSKANTPSTSEKTSANVTPTQSSVKRTPGKSTAKIPETADVIKQELMLAKKVLYSNAEHIPFWKVTQLKEHIEDLKKSLKAAKSREEKAVLVTKLDLSEKKEFKVPKATSKTTNRGLVALNENLISGIHASSTAVKERLFFEDFENLLTMNNNSFP